MKIIRTKEVIERTSPSRTAIEQAAPQAAASRRGQHR